MKKAQQRGLITRARLAQHHLTLSGGFAAFATNNPLRGWYELEAPWKGQLRLIPAVNAQGMAHWRHATAVELLRWAMAGCPDWNRELHPPVIAAGSVYGLDGAMLRRDDTQVGNIELLTVRLNTTHKSSGARLRAFLQERPEAMALCVVPRG